VITVLLKIVGEGKTEGKFNQFAMLTTVLFNFYSMLPLLLLVAKMTGIKHFGVPRGN
jgi:hypothetical protein